MRIERPLLKLPIRFCGETLAKEVSALPTDAWIEHPQKFDGNIAVPIVAPGGEITQSAYGPMGPTRWLDDCPYIADVMRALQATWGRSRLMGLEAGAIVPEHVDIHYYWRTHLRVHIPVITNPGVDFTCAGETVHMKPGECWLLDSFYKHQVANRGSELRIHLVMDTVGSAFIWDLIAAALRGTTEETFIAPGTTKNAPIDFEQINAPLVMSPWEVQTHIAYLAEWTDPQSGRDEMLALVDRFAMTWAGAWARYGTSEEGFPVYFQHINDFHAILSNYRGRPVIMRNGRGLRETIVRFILVNALSQDVSERLERQAAATRRFA